MLSGQVCQTCRCGAYEEHCWFLNAQDCLALLEAGNLALSIFMPPPAAMLCQSLPLVIPLSAAVYLFMVYLVLALAQRTKRVP